jgi:hypothetical protein
MPLGNNFLHCIKNNWFAYCVSELKICLNTYIDSYNFEMILELLSS